MPTRRPYSWKKKRITEKLPGQLEFIADVPNGLAAISNTRPVLGLLFAAGWGQILASVRRTLLTCSMDTQQSPNHSQFLAYCLQQVGGRSWPQEFIADVPNGLEAMSNTMASSWPTYSFAAAGWGQILASGIDC